MEGRICAFLMCILLVFTGFAYAEATAVLTLPSALKVIREEAFYQASSVKKVIIPEGATEIGPRAFAQSTLQEITIPGSVTSIADDAFEGCGNLIATVENNSYAFNWCIEHKVQIAGLEMGEPTGIYLGVTGINLVEGEAVQLRTSFRSDSVLFDDTVSFKSSAPTVAKVDENGVVTAVSIGYTVVTAQTVNGLEDSCIISVTDADTVQSRSFGWETATIVAGDSEELEVILNKADFERGYSISSSNPQILAVDADALTITALEAGEAELTLEINPAGDGGEAETITSAISVVEATDVRFSAEELRLRTLTASTIEESRAVLTLDGLPEDLIGTFELYSEDESVAVYVPDEGVVQAQAQEGSTRIVCKTFSQEVYCTVTAVFEPTYRALIIGEFNNSGASNDLPFASNNLNSMNKIISSAKLDGADMGYEKIVKLFSNPSKTEIRNSIRSTFSDAIEGDVSVIYIVSHGYDVAANGGYHFGMSNYSKADSSTYIGHAELMDWMMEIRGDVVLILDSCKSGGFIRDEQSRLSAAGNIAVLTAQTADKNASFFNGKSSATKVEFLTYVFCQGCGYEYDTSTTLASLPADDNADSLVSVYESFDYCVDEVPGLVMEKAEQYFVAGSTSGFVVPGVSTLAQLKAWGGQNPQIHIPGDLRDLIIFGR